MSFAKTPRRLTVFHVTRRLCMLFIAQGLLILARDKVPIWARLTLASIHDREEQSTCSHVQVPNYANVNYFSVASVCRLESTVEVYLVKVDRSWTQARCVTSELSVTRPTLTRLSAPHAASSRRRSGTLNEAAG